MARQKSLSRSITPPNLLAVWGNRYASFIFLIFSCILLFVSSIQPKMVEKTHISIASITAPLLEVASRPFVHVANTSADISRLALLQSENERLRAENKELRRWYLKALSLNTEVQSAEI